MNEHELLNWKILSFILKLSNIQVDIEGRY